MAAFDVHENHLWMHQKKRKRWKETLAFFKCIRKRYPDKRTIHLVLDNLSTHKHRRVVDYCKANDIIQVFTATYASWMNRIECHFAPVKYFVINNSDHANHQTIGKALQEYLRWRNKNSRDKELLKRQNACRVL